MNVCSMSEVCLYGCMYVNVYLCTCGTYEYHALDALRCLILKFNYSNLRYHKVFVLDVKSTTGYNRRQYRIVVVAYSTKLSS